MADKNYYDVLGVPKGAGEDEIKRAYRKLAKENHPDLHPGDKAAEARFKEVNTAYETLSDSTKRANYDRFGSAEPGAGFGGGYSGGMDFDFGDLGGLGSIFENFFGGGAGTSSRPRNAAARGADVRAGVTITFEEAAFGCKKEITVSRVESCPKCSGSGAAPGTRPETCSACGGAGEVRTTKRTPLGFIQNVGICPSCNGRGKTIKTPCPECRGRGSDNARVAVTVDIPAGIDNNQTVRLRGQGSAGSNGGQTGDVLLTIRVTEHGVFRRDGTVIHIELPISVTQAALGADVSVPTLDGALKYSVPPGTQNGDVFKLRGKGVPELNAPHRRGDELVHIRVEIPTNLNKRQKELLKEFEEISSKGKR